MFRKQHKKVRALTPILISLVICIC
jgi:hypothetical protein